MESSLFQVGHCILSSTALLFLCMCAGVVSLFGDQCSYGYFFSARNNSDFADTDGLSHF